MSNSAPVPRRRVVYLTALAGVVGAGLASRWDGAFVPQWVAAYAGDTLWATAAFLVIAVALPRCRTGTVAGLALAVSFGVEALQLWHPPWLEACRATVLGALLLGHDFVWTDLVCYTVGIAAAAGVETVWRRRRSRRTCQRG